MRERTRERESERARERERKRQRERDSVFVRVLLQALALESLVLDENNISDLGATKLGPSLRHRFLKSALEKRILLQKKNL